MQKEPMFYQHVTTKILEALIKQQCPLTTDPFVVPEAVDKMTYKEERLWLQYRYLEYWHDTFLWKVVTHAR